MALGRDVAGLLGSTTWSGGGPGMMEAATRGALQAGGEVGGIRIEREVGQIVRLVQGATTSRRATPPSAITE